MCVRNADPYLDIDHQVKRGQEIVGKDAAVPIIIGGCFSLYGLLVHVVLSFHPHSFCQGIVQSVNALHQFHLLLDSESIAGSYAITSSDVKISISYLEQHHGIVDWLSSFEVCR